MEELIKRITKFRDDRNWSQFHNPENLAKSIIIEAAELLENFQWDSEYNEENVKDELADVMNYCILLADHLGIDIIENMNRKIDKNEKKYPVNKAKGTSKKYTELLEVKEENQNIPTIWEEFIKSKDMDPKTPYEAWAFGSAPETADELLELVLLGKKRATTSLYKIYGLENEPIPQKGDYSIILDGCGRQRCIIQTTKVSVISFDDVDEAFAAREGEGDLSLEYWRDVHRKAFSDELKASACHLMMI